MSQLDGMGFYVVAVRAVENNNYAVAQIQCDGEVTCLVAVQLAFEVRGCRVDVIGAVVEWCLGDRFHWIMGVVAGATRIDQMLARRWSMCLVSVLFATLMKRHKCLVVRHNRPWKYLMLMALYRVKVTGNPMVAC